MAVWCLPGGKPPARVAVVHGEASHAHDATAVAAREPVDDVDVMGALLKQQAVAGRLMGASVAEVTATVGDEVAAPHGLDLPDHTRIDDLLHLADDRDVAHVVAEEELGSGAHRGAEDFVAVLDGEGHGLFKVHGLARLQRGDGKSLWYWSRTMMKTASTSGMANRSRGSS